MPSYHEINPARRIPLHGGVGHARGIADLRMLARRKLPNFLYEYLEGGADCELTLRRNMASFDAWLWLPRMAVDMGDVGLRTQLFGRDLAFPVLIAPTGFNGMLWRDGDLALARAAASAGLGMVQSTVSMNSIEDVASVDGLRHWFQLYPYGGPEVTARLLERALAAGSEALVVTIDGAVPGNRVWDQRSYRAPGRLTLRSKLDALRHPHWLAQVLLRSGPPNFVNLAEFLDEPNPSVFAVGRWIAANRPRLSWTDVEVLRMRWPRKLIVKGILREDEALRARDSGADAIILSNHGGRQAEPAIASLEALPGIRARLGPEFPILLDSGIRGGGHIAVAVALGANAVLTGRATLYGLAAGGQAGVTKALEILRTEFARTLALSGIRDVSDLGRDCLTLARNPG